MDNYQSFDDFANCQSPQHQEAITQLRRLVKKLSPKLEETVKWGNGCWMNGNLPTMFVHCEGGSMQLGFFGGAMLTDPNNVLKGSAQYVRHIPINSTDDINEEVLTPLIKQASVLDYKK